MSCFGESCMTVRLVTLSCLLAGVTMAPGTTNAQDPQDLKIHNAAFNLRKESIGIRPLVNDAEGWLEFNGCCFGIWDGTGYFGDEDSVSGPSYLYLGNQSPGDLISDSASFPIGAYEPNTTYTLTWSVGTRTEHPGSVSEDNVIIGPPEDDELRLYYLNDDVETGSSAPYELVVAASLESLGYEFTQRTPGWIDLSLEFTTGVGLEPWLGRPIAVGYSRTNFWGFGEPLGAPPFPKEEWRWQSNVDDVRLTALPSDQPAALRPGDANQDLVFNQMDIVQVLQRAKYLTGEPASWGEGDWDRAPGGTPGNPPIGDGLFDQLDIVAALQDGRYRPETVAAIQPIGNQNTVAQAGLGEGFVVGDWTVIGPSQPGGTPINFDLIPIPEPSSVVLFAFGALAVGLAFYRVQPRRAT